MKMKKHPSSLRVVRKRTCPHCFTRIDPLWYGWHIIKCFSYNKQDMNISTTHNMNEIENPQLVVAACKEGQSSLPSSCTLSLPPFSQLMVDNCSEINTTDLLESSKSEILHLRSEKRALVDKVKGLEHKLEELEEQFKAEKIAFMDKVKGLELNVQELECQLRSSREAKQRTEGLVELSLCGLGEGIEHVKEAGMDMRSNALELMGLYSEKQTMELADDGPIAYEKEGVELLDRGDCPSQSKEPVQDMVLIEHAVNSKICQMNKGDSFNRLKEPAEKTASTEHAANSKHSKLDNIVGLAGVGEPISLDFLSCVDELIKSHKVLSVMHTTSQAQEMQETAQNTSREDNGLDLSAKNKLLAKTNEFRQSDLESHKAVSETHDRAVDKDMCIDKCQVLCHEEALVNDDRSYSCPDSTDLGAHVVKAKVGLRRIVLSDSESEGGSMKDNGKGDDHQDVCHSVQLDHCKSNEKFSEAPCSSARLVDEQSEDSDIDARNIHTESRKRVQCVNDFEDGKQISVRRSKRLKRLANLKVQNEEQGASSMRKTPRALTSNSSSTETSGSSPNLVATADIPRKSSKMTLDTRTKPLSKQKLGRCVEVPSSTSAESSSQLEEFAELTSEKRADISGKAGKQRSRRRLSNVRKRLFAEVESKPAIGSKHGEESKDDNESEMESDDYSLKDFIVTDSDGSEDLRSSSNCQASSRTHSSKEVYCNPRLERDLKIWHYVWELEAEMLAAFAKSPELCLRAVCAINRRQTEDEQQAKISKYQNKRGFDKSYASRGTRIAVFLTDGDPSGPVKKSFKELESFDAGGLELCKMLASMHSKQLFDIYRNAEDPHFPFT